MTLFAVGVALAMVQPAGAATTVGQVSNNADPNNCPPEFILVTTAVSSGTPFTVPAGGGVITSWQTNVGSGSAGTDAKLKVFRATMDPSQFLVVGQSALEPMTVSSLNGPFPARIPVREGDYVSIRPGDNGGPCNTLTGNMTDSSRTSTNQDDTPTGSTTFFGPFPSTEQRANVSASLEADADGDAFGDETQDPCPGVTGTIDGCTSPPPPPSGQQPLATPAAAPPTKKCKKGKRLKKGKCVKKKRKRKKTR